MVRGRRRMEEGQNEMARRQKKRRTTMKGCKNSRWEKDRVTEWLKEVEGRRQWVMKRQMEEGRGRRGRG